MTTTDFAPVQATLSYEGAPTFTRLLRERVLQGLMVGTFGDTFYADKRELDEQFMNVLLEVRNDDPEFLAKAIIYARNKGLIKDANTKALAVLAGGRGKTRAPFEAIFNRTILIPDDLREFVRLVSTGEIPGKRGLGGYAAEAVANWLSTISEYHALKYGSSASEGVTIPDMVRMSHPRPANAAVAERLGWLVNGDRALGTNLALNPQIRAFETLKRTATEDEQITLIREGNLPFEVVLPALKVTTPRVWRELLYNAPYLNLLRNLVTFTRHGVFADEANVQYAVEKLTSPQAVLRSKVLPFRFFDAWKRYVASENSDSRIADALRTAANLSFVNIPTFGNSTVCIGSDVSGSMCNTFGKGVTTYIDICGILTGALLRCVNNRAIALPFQDRVITGHGLSSHDDVLVTAEKVSRLGGGGTALGAPIEHLLRSNTKVDVFIGITDNEDWAHGRDYYCHGSFLEVWRQYRSTINPEAKAFVVRIDPYGHAVAPVNEPGVHFIYGWSDAVVKYIPLMMEGGESQLREVSRMSLDTAAERQVFGTDDQAQTEEE